MQQRPNLVFVFPDQMRRHAAGCMGQDPVITPHLDNFAAQSLVLTNAVSNFPVCSPYRAMLMTGKYPYSNGVVINCNSNYPEAYLRPEDRCISDVLDDAGYSLGYLGKWHLDAPHKPYVEPARADGYVWDEYTPSQRRHGFDFWYSYGVKDSHLQPHYWIGEAPREQDTQFQEWSPRHEADVAIEYLRNRAGQHRRAEQPFALFWSLNPPHTPFDAVPDEYLQRYAEYSDDDLLNRPNLNQSGSLAGHNRGLDKIAHHARGYFAAVTGVDEQFGRVLRCLRQEGLEENTIVIFTSDHGEMMGSHGLMHKNVLYEESIGVPFFMRWPGHVQPRQDDLLLGAPDLMPTLLGLLGLSGDIPSVVEGRNYAQIMLGQDGPRPTSALLMSQLDPSNPAAGQRGLRTLQHTFVAGRSGVHPNGNGTDISYVLFDNETDPYQLHNIAAEQPQLVAELHGELNHWLRQTRDPWLETTWLEAK